MPVESIKRLFAGCVYFLQLSPPRLAAPTVSAEFGHGNGGFVVPCHCAKVGVQEFLTIVTQHWGTLKECTLRFQRAQCD
jgi:hypothetical protein